MLSIAIRTPVYALAFAVTAAFAPAAEADASESEAERSAEKLKTITVTGEAATGLTSPSLAESRQQLSQVPGGTSLIKAEEYKAGRVGGLEDVLAFTPGVYVQSQGNGESEIMIRGSGLAHAFSTRGVVFLRNGLPLNDADGAIGVSQLTPLNARYVEVYRGASALRYGAATLGGAINFVTHTGYTAAPLRVRLSGGSSDTRRALISSGQVFGPHWDGYAAISGKHRDGFRGHSESERWQVFTNVGYRHGANAETRVYFNFHHTRREIAGDLTLAQVREDPTQAKTPPCSPRAPFCGNVVLNDTSTSEDLYRLAVQHAIDTADGKLAFGAFYQYNTFYLSIAPFVLEQHESNYGVSMRHALEYALAGHENDFVWGGSVVAGNETDRFYEQAGYGHKGALTRITEKDAVTASVFAENRWHWRPELTLIAGAQLAWAYRREKDTSTARPGTGVDLSESYTSFNPKLGLVWQTTPAIQVFGNVSRSFAPPTLSQFTGVDGEPLDAQRAVTAEIGARAHTGLLSWQVSLYRSWLNDEILVRKLPKGQRRRGKFGTDNVDDSLHTGVEIGFDLNLPLGAVPGSLHLRGAYTYGDFRFDDHPAFGDNTLPGIPEHFGRLALTYEHASGFYIGPRLEAADSYYVDYANTLKAPSYVIWGLRAGYESDQFKLFVDAHNLEDEHYVANTGIIPDATARRGAPNVFSPGRLRSVYVGVIMEWE